MQHGDLSAAQVDHIAVLQQQAGRTLEKAIILQTEALRRSEIFHQLLFYHCQWQRKVPLQPVLLQRMNTVLCKLPMPADVILVNVGTGRQNRQVGQLLHLCTQVTNAQAGVDEQGTLFSQ